MLSNRQLFLSNQAQTSNFPLMLEIERAEGVYLYDTNNKPYLDLISGISVSSLGHGNEAVKNAIKKQVDTHMHLLVYGELIQQPQVHLAKRLSDLLPQNLSSIYFVNSGAEATDGGMKLAKRYTGRSQVIACKKGYHGSTHAALSLNSDEYYKQAYRPLLPDIDFIEFNKEETLSKITDRTACVFAETIQGEAGCITPENNFLQKLRKKCDETGALLVLDEIQTGIGRTGKMFAFEHYNVHPDILLLGKALGAGMPIGAFISSQKIMSSLAENPMLGHLTTFGGHPVVCAAALAGINELLDKNLMADVKTKETIFREELKDIDVIKKISGKGLMLAIELENFEMNMSVIKSCLSDRLLTDWFLFANNCMRVVPPLIITEKEIKWACGIIKKNLLHYS